MSNKVRCAVIGAGWWGTTAHVPALKRHPKAELVAVQHLDPEIARKTAENFNVPHGCATLEQVLVIEGLDAVVVSSTPNMHYSQAKAALEHGLHVLIEKPMTLKADKAQELVAIAEKKGLQFLIGCPSHYTSHGAEARRLIHTGELGQVKMITMLMTDRCLGLYQGVPWIEVVGDYPDAETEACPYLEPGRKSYSDPIVSGGGQLFCQVSHAAAYLPFLTGQEPTQVHAHLDKADTQVDVYNALNIKLDGGTLVSLASTGATHFLERMFSVQVYGTKGILTLELFKGTMRFCSMDGKTRQYPQLPDDEIYPMYSPAENLVDVVLGEAPNRSPATLGASAMKIIEAACQSAETGQNVMIESV